MPVRASPRDPPIRTDPPPAGFRGLRPGRLGRGAVGGQALFFRREVAGPEPFRNSGAGRADSG